MAELILEYLKVILSGPVIFGAIAAVFFFKFSEDIKALILRVAKIRLPGGAEVSTPQSSRLPEGEDKAPPEQPDEDVQGLPLGLTTDQHATVEQLIQSHRANAYMWEYRYLNYYLARDTQIVLDWLGGLDVPVTFAHFDTHWLPLIPSAGERQAIIQALESHHLVYMDSQTTMIRISEKGQEYREWRGEVPPPASTP